MTPSKQCKQAGLESLSQLVQLSGIPKSTLLDWHKSNQAKFTLAIDAVLWRRDTISTKPRSKPCA